MAIAHMIQIASTDLRKRADKEALVIPNSIHPAAAPANRGRQRIEIHPVRCTMILTSRMCPLL
ncbi:hypothetical protein K290105B7_13150 [Anaerostipes caccae]|nr:hypothetical protein ANCC_13730 [Anaerostipes caccae L1-92]